MGLELEYIGGQTPIDEDEKRGLLIPTITMRSELDEFEQQNIEKRRSWSMSRSFTSSEVLTEEFVACCMDACSRMCGIGQGNSDVRIKISAWINSRSVWNFGICSMTVDTGMSNNTYPATRVAVRFSHRLVFIHCFPNGNGRHSRLMADVLVEKVLQRPVFTWGSITLSHKGNARSAYLHAHSRGGQGGCRSSDHLCEELNPTRYTGASRQGEQR
jgi:hypothetical protein